MGRPQYSYNKDRYLGWKQELTYTIENGMINT